MIRQKIAKGIASLFKRLSGKNPELGENLISLYRGESFPQRNMQAMKDSAKYFKTTLDEMIKDNLSGQWYTPNKEHAKYYASGLLSKLKEIKVTPKELKDFYRYKTRVNKTNLKYANRKDMRFGVTESPHHVIVPRYKLKELPSKTDYLIEDKIMGKYQKGGLATILQIWKTKL